MCGILGIATTAGRRLELSTARIEQMRDEMSHRGPDGAGLWRNEHVALAHRRLAVIDPSEAGAQPMVDDEASPRFVLTYNGELYNERELRADLERRGERFASTCDTETVLRAWACWGTSALERMRGMFAFGVYDARLKTLTLVRDPLGVKPLLWWCDGSSVVFASEVRPILAHPEVMAAPNPRMVSAYLTTIRTVLGSETLFQGVRSVRPGEMVQIDLGAPGERGIVASETRWWRGARPSACGDDAEARARVRDSVRGSVLGQLRSDVPLCTLLSGGIDSTIIAGVAAGEVGELRSFCSGAPGEGDSDLTAARAVAGEIGTIHDEAPIDQGLFEQRWPEMVDALGVPLSTPNEVAINEVARRLRSTGCVVTLSGEGADELFAGYEAPMDSAAAFIHEGGGPDRAGAFELDANAWAPVDFKPGILRERAWEAAEEDSWLTGFYTREFGRACEETGERGLGAHLRFHRMINLTGLLARLDTATMLAGVEGRTPFADGEVAHLAESIPLSFKFREMGADADTGSGSAATRTATAVRTKLVLREAFAGDVPSFVLQRPKASFPLPFQDWMGPHAEALRRSSLAREIFRDEAVNAVSSEPGKLWRLAWPMINIAMWGERWGW